MDATGVETKGTIAALSSSTLTLLAEGTRRELSEDDVRTIKQRRSDSLANGALFGACRWSSLRHDRDDRRSGAKGGRRGGLSAVLGIYTAIGTGIGVAVDAVIRRHHVIYRRQPTLGVQMGISPWLTRHHQGVLVTVRF